MMVDQNLRNLDAIVVSISGGGMASGVAIAAKHLNPDIKGSKWSFNRKFYKKFYIKIPNVN